MAEHNPEEVRQDYLVTPAEGRGAGVLVLHSGRGLTPFVRELNARFARHGFVAMAVDMFAGRTPETPAESDAVTSALDADETRRDLEDATVFLQSHRAVSRPLVGVVGLGFGGKWAVRLARAMPDTVGSVVGFYPVPDRHWTDLTQPLQLHFAEQDREVPPSTVRSVERELQRAEVRADVNLYGGVEPSFFETDETARHDPHAAHRAWDRTVEFLSATLYR